MQTRLMIGAVLLSAAPTIALAQPAAPAPTPEAAPAPAMPSEPAPTAEPAPAPAPTPEPAAPVVAAAEPAPEPVAEVDTAVEEKPTAWYDALQVNGFASVAFSFNANRPAEETNQMRVFDGDDGTINVDVVEVVVQKPAAEVGQAGFRVDLTAGSTIPQATASAGLFRDEEGTAEDFDLQQAFVSYIGDVGAGLRLDVGKFVTNHGYELIEGYDGYNDHYSRSILFGYAIPFTHTGAKVTYPISDKLTGMVMVVNGWDNVKDNNSGKTFGGQLGAVLGPATAWLNYCGGPEQAGENGNWRHLVDLVATVKPVDMITIGFNADYGYEKSVVDIGDATWMGAALYGKWDATSAVSLAARGEVFKDSDGARTGVAQTIVEGTLSPAVKLGNNFVLRGDVRIDRSNEEVFMTSDGSSQRQLTVAINALGVL